MGFHGDNCVSQRYAPVTVQTFCVMAMDVHSLAYGLEYFAVTVEEWRRRADWTVVSYVGDNHCFRCDVCDRPPGATICADVGYADVPLHRKLNYLPNKQLFRELIWENLFFVEQNVCYQCYHTFGRRDEIWEIVRAGLHIRRRGV